jgi:N6-L-threonylcarbamoyladenine synthase
VKTKKKINILAIESSCDDTSAAVMSDGKILSNIVASQSIHKEYGGVVPELASRAHMENILPVVDVAIQKAKISLEELSAIALTRGPGLLGSLIVGTGFAKGLALSLDIPLIEVNHMEAHVLAHFIEDPKPAFPFLCLTVSGGHTQIVLVKSALDLRVVGTTRDDAAGETFDKAGKMMGLDYPAGPIIDKLAKEGNPVYKFPIPSVSGLDFSFSGLKTAILYFLRDKKKEDPNFLAIHLNDICASIQYTIVYILIEKLKKAAQEYGINNMAIAGGVSANSGLRNGLIKAAEEEGWNTFIPKFEYCTDNAAMIAMSGYLKYQDGQFAPQTIKPMARFPMEHI